MAAAWQAGFAGLPAMGQGCRLSRAQPWRPPWTLEMRTAIPEKSLRRHLVLQCCPQWIVARLTSTLRKRHAQRSMSLLFQLAPWDRPGLASNTVSQARLTMRHVYLAYWGCFCGLRWNNSDLISTTKQMRGAKSLLSLDPHGWRFYKPVGLTTTVTAPGLLVVSSSAGEGEAAVVADVPPTLLKGPPLPPAPAVPPTSPPPPPPAPMRPCW